MQPHITGTYEKDTTEFPQDSEGDEAYPEAPSIIHTSAEQGSLEKLSLPTFEKEGDQNADFYLKMLREYFELKEIPSRLWLSLALRSLRGKSVRASSVAITDILTSYSEFKKAFLGQFWDDITQNRVRFRLFQGKCDGSKGVSMADHCLKFAVLAKFLRPPMNETEIMGALKCHFEPYVHLVRLTAPIKTVQDANKLILSESNRFRDR
jgi:hypothetical protein